MDYVRFFHTGIVCGIGHLDSAGFPGAALINDGAGEYFNGTTGYMLLATVIQRITGEHASVAVRQRIHDPLDLTQTYYQVHEGDGSALVVGYYLEDGEFIDTHFWVSHNAFGSGAIATTTADLARFYRAIFDDRQLLNQQARKEMLKKNLVEIDPLESMGLGIVKTDGGNIISYWHNGGRGRLFIHYSVLSLP